ncbi:MAG: matrixin family metalloprotease [Limisphaerales bacterium]
MSFRSRIGRVLLGGSNGIGLILAIATTAQPVRGYVFEMNASGQLRRWQLENPDTRVKTSSVNRSTRAIIYRLDAAGFSTGNASNELNAVRAAFDQWQGIDGTRLKFEEGPLVTGTRDVNSQDHTNTVFWTRDVSVNGGRDNLRGILALTYVASFSNGNVVFDADTVFNGAEFQWFTDVSDPTTQKVFVEAIALHEIGHFVGLQHSPAGAATMLVAGEFGLNSQLGLSPDEVSAARGLYPTADMAARVGRVTGRVLAAGQPVFGAAVFAEGAQGDLLAGTVSREDGTFSLAGLLAGVHVIRSAPLDPATSLNYLVRGADISAAYTAAQTSFVPSNDRVVTLPAGGTVANADLDVTGGSPPRIARLLRPASNLSSPSFTSFPVGLPPDGATRYVGVLTTTAATADLDLEVTGKGFESGPVEVRANALPGMNLVALPITVATNAQPGLRSFRLRSGSRSGWAHGFLEIQPRFPDANRDGLDDTFQRTYWSRFTVPEAGPTADPDDDGFSNDWEFRTGSVPTDRNSAHFEIQSVRVTGAGAVVVSQAAKGKRFQLQGRDTEAGAPWEPVGGPLTASSDLLEFTDPAATRTVRFYRVVLLP